jgi:hypothetical protein
MPATVKRILLLSLALILSFTLLGCAGGGLPQEEIDRIVANATTAYAEINTGKFDYTDLSMTIEAVGGAEPGTVTMVGDGAVVIDIANREMQMTMNMTMDIAEQGEQEMATAMYVVDEWLYTMAEYAGEGEQWQKTELTEELWQQQSYIEQQIDFLKTAVEINYLGSEAVNGTDCYVFEVVPSMEALGNLMVQQLQSLGIDFSQVNLADLFKEMSVKEWIAKDTYWVMKAEVGALLEMHPEDLGYTEDDFEKMTIDTNTGLTFYDYNQPVDITLPPAALDAEEVSY